MGEKGMGRADSLKKVKGDRMQRAGCLVGVTNRVSLGER